MTKKELPYIQMMRNNDFYDVYNLMNKAEGFLEYLKSQKYPAHNAKALDYFGKVLKDLKSSYKFNIQEWERHDGISSSAEEDDEFHDHLNNNYKDAYLHLLQKMYIYERTYNPQIPLLTTLNLDRKKKSVKPKSKRKCRCKK